MASFFFVKIFDIGGQLRQQQSVQLKEGVTQATIDVSGLHQGVYFFQLSNGRQGQTSKFIKE